MLLNDAVLNQSVAFFTFTIFNSFTVSYDVKESVHKWVVTLVPILACVAMIHAYCDIKERKNEAAIAHTVLSSRTRVAIAAN